MATSPTQRTIKACKDLGRDAGIVERFNSFVGPHGIRQDLFGFIDIICIDPDQGIIAVQSCGQDFAGHIKKMTDERNEPMINWLKHAPVELWGWRKVKVKLASGGYGKALRWRPRIADFRYNEETDSITYTERGR